MLGRRLLVLLMVLAIVAVTGFAATDANFNAKGYPIVKQPITLKMMGSKTITHGPWDKMLVFQEVEKKTGIHIVWDTPPENIYMERKSIIFAANELPDAFFKGQLSSQEVADYGSQGLLIPLNKLIDKYAPNFKKVLREFPDVKKTITSADGNIYCLTGVTGYADGLINAPTWINKKWLDALKLPMPTTTDELYKVLKAFKEKDPNGNGKQDEIPLAAATNFAVPTQAPDIIHSLRGCWGLGNRGTTGTADFDLDKSGKVRYIPVDSRYKELLAYINKLYVEGLVDKELFTQKKAQYQAKGSQGLYGMFIRNTPDQAGAVKYMADYVGTGCFKGPHGDKLHSNVSDRSSNPVGAFAITKKNRYPEATMRWVDYFYGEEGAILMAAGIKGVTYQVLPDGTITYMENITKNPQGLTQNDAIGQFSPIPGGGIPRLILEKYDLLPKNAPAAKAARASVVPYIPKEVWPEFTFTEAERAQLSVLQNDINTYVREMEAKFIMGAEPLSSWDKYVAQVKRIGLAKLLEIYTAAYKRWKSGR